MNGDQEAVGPVVRKVVTVAFKGFVLVPPHAEAVVGLRQPVFEVVHDDFVRRIISRDALENDLALAVVHLCVSLATLGVLLPCKTGGVHIDVLPFDGIESPKNVPYSAILSRSL